MNNGNSSPTLAELLGLDCRTLIIGSVTFNVSKFTLAQLDQVKNLIVEVQEASTVDKEFTDTATGAKMAFKETDIVQGFLKVQSLIPRLLNLCVTSQPAISVSELPVDIAIQLLKLAVEVNSDFFSGFSALLETIREKIDQAAGKATQETKEVGGLKLQPVSSVTESQ